MYVYTYLRMLGNIYPIIVLMTKNPHKAYIVSIIRSIYGYGLLYHHQLKFELEVSDWHAAGDIAYM